MSDQVMGWGDIAEKEEVMPIPDVEITWYDDMVSWKAWNNGRKYGDWISLDGPVEDRRAFEDTVRRKAIEALEAHERQRRWRRK